MVISEEGEQVDPNSIITLAFTDHLPTFPIFKSHQEDPFLLRIQQSGRKWVIITDSNDEAHYALDADNFLREVFFSSSPLNPLHFLPQVHGYPGNYNQPFRLKKRSITPATSSITPQKMK